MTAKLLRSLECSQVAADEFVDVEAEAFVGDAVLEVGWDELVVASDDHFDRDVGTSGRRAAAATRTPDQSG